MLSTRSLTLLLCSIDCLRSVFDNTETVQQDEISTDITVTGKGTLIKPEECAREMGRKKTYITIIIGYKNGEFCLGLV